MGLLLGLVLSFPMPLMAEGAVSTCEGVCEGGQSVGCAWPGGAQSCGKQSRGRIGRNDCGVVNET